MPAAGDYVEAEPSHEPIDDDYVEAEPIDGAVENQVYLSTIDASGVRVAIDALADAFIKAVADR